VLVEEIVTLHGLEVQRRKVAYGNINPKDATAIFIRSALVEENLLPTRGKNEPEDDVVLNSKFETRTSKLSQSLLTSSPTSDELPSQYPFLSHNRAVRQKIENWQTRVRHYGLADLDQALMKFYFKHIENVSSTHELNR